MVYVVQFVKLGFDSVRSGVLKENLPQLVRFSVTQLLKSCLKGEKLNIKSISVTLLSSQRLMSWLKSDTENISDISVILVVQTALTSSYCSNIPTRPSHHFCLLIQSITS